MLIKRPIYNQQLKCVAMEILANRQARDMTELLQPFNAIITSTESNLPLFIPYAFKALAEQPEFILENPVILKLHAADIDAIYPRTELETSPYSIALLMDDPKQLSWLNFAEYIALNEILMSMTDVSKIVKFSHANHRKVMAYDIASNTSFEHCKSGAMDFYCGDFLFQPNHTEQTEIAANKLNLLELISKLQQDDVSFETISGLIQTDPLLSYQLLRIANSVAFSGYEAIESIQQAVVRLGIINLKNWILILSMKNITNKPLEIVDSGLIRAQMAKKLATAGKDISPQSAYTAGLLSVLDSLLDSPMQLLIDKITLTQDIKKALLSGEGILGELLTLVVNYEKGNWEQLTTDEYKGLNLSEVYINCLEQVSIGRKALHG